MSASEQIHPEDHLYKFIIRVFGDAGHAAYLRGGLVDGYGVQVTAKALGLPDDAAILEFASGYGRITRHSRVIWPKANYIASDIHPDAVDFTTNVLGVPAFLSATDPGDLKAPQTFDFIFVMSLFSHLPHRTFSRWLQALYDLLNPGGQILFTTQGETTLKNFGNATFDAGSLEEGWLFRNTSDQPDLDFADYGTMIVKPAYVLAAIAGTGGMLTRFEAGRMLTHQDVWAVKKPG